MLPLSAGFIIRNYNDDGGIRDRSPSLTSCCDGCLSISISSGRNHRPSPTTGLRAKRKNRARPSRGSGSKRKRCKQSNNDKNIDTDSNDDSNTNTTPQQLSTAVNRPPASLAGITEDHRYEQFFYDDTTAAQLYNIVDMYDKPLLLCNPTLAVMAEQKSKPYYKLLDRDTRFNFLSGYESFSLTEPHLITGYDFDAVFIDPPFANVTPNQVAQCLRLMGADRVPLWVAYNSRRETQLLDALNALDCPTLEPKWSLSYKEGVSMDTQDSIWLYGPE